MDAGRTPLQALQSVTGRLVAVTGGAEGIGLATVRAFAQLGARIALCDIDAAALAQVSAELEALGVEHSCTEADVTDAQQLHRFFSATRSTLGPIDSLVVVPGDGRFGSFARSDPSTWTGLVEANYLQAARSLHAVLPDMQQRHSGTVVFVGSIESERAVPGLAMYGAMKAALTSLTRTVAVEVAAHGIRINCVAPDMIRSRNVVRSGLFRADPDDQIEQFSNRVTIPMGRKGWPDEVANAVVFLSCDLASYITGVVLPVDGGTLPAGSWMRWEEGFRNQLPDSVTGALLGPVAATHSAGACVAVPPQ